MTRFSSRKGTALCRLIIVIALACLTVGPALAAGPKKLAILPFTANAQQDVSFLVKGIRDMLTTRLAWQDKVTVLEPDVVSRAMQKVPGPYNDAKARHIGQELGADVVVFGSVTVLGKSVSLDARLVQVGSDTPPLTAYVGAATMDQVIPSINQFAKRINAEIFARPEAMAEMKRQELEAQASRESGQGMSEEERKLAAGGSSAVDALPANISPLNPLFRRALSGVESDRYWRSPRMDGQITSLAVGDIDLDGKNELVVALPNRIRVYRLAGKHFALISELRNGPKGNYLFVDIMDVDGNGRPEIFVSNMNYKTMESFVLEMDQSRLVMKYSDLRWHFRVQPAPGGKKMLMGQRSAVDEPFFGPIYELEFKNGQYQPKRQLSLPRLAYIYNFAFVDVHGNGAPVTALLDYGNHLRLYNESRKQTWKGSEIYCASAKYIEHQALSGDGVAEGEWFFLPTRIVPTDLNNDARQEVVVVQNDDRAMGLMGRLKLYYQGTIFSLEYAGFGMVENWRTPRISGYLTDYAIADVGNVGRPALVMSVGETTKEGFFEKGTSYVVAFTLKPSSTKSKVKPNKGL